MSLNPTAVGVSRLLSEAALNRSEQIALTLLKSEMNTQVANPHDTKVSGVSEDNFRKNTIFFE